MLEAGANLISGVWEGVSGSMEWFKGKLSEWVGNITDYFAGLFGIHSPSTLMRDRIGKLLPPGIAEGIEDESDVVEKAMRALVDDATSIGLNIGDVKLHAASGYGLSQIAQTSGAVSNATYNTFNQYNTSPKALSRLDIYRQTRNQLAFAGGL